VHKHISLALLFVVSLVAVGCKSQQPKTESKVTETPAVTAPAAQSEAKATEPAPVAETPVETVPQAVAPSTDNAFLAIEPAKEFSDAFVAFWGPDATTAASFVQNFEATSKLKLDPAQVQFVQEQVVPRMKTIAQKNFDELGGLPSLPKTLAQIAQFSKDIAKAIPAAVSAPGNDG